MGFPWNVVIPAAGAVLSSVIGSRSASSAANRASRIPSPQEGTRLGAHDQAYMDAVFPGTNPWERLGVPSTGSPIEVAREGTRKAAQVKSAELKTQGAISAAQMLTQKQIAQIQADAQVKSAEISAGARTTAACLLYTSPSPRDRTRSRMPSSA